MNFKTIIAIATVVALIAMIVFQVMEWVQY